MIVGISFLGSHAVMTSFRKYKRTFVDLNGLKLFTRDTEAGAANMLCLHGKWGRGETWADLIERYRDRYRILAPDQRGHGLSDKPVCRYTAELQAEDAHALLAKLQATPAIVLGHSMGGRVGAYLAAGHPEDVSALALIDIGASGPINAPPGEPEMLPARDGLTDDWPTPYASYQQAAQHLQQVFNKYPSNVRYFLESLVETEQGYDFLFSRPAIGSVGAYQADWFHLLPRIQCPVLLLQGSDAQDRALNDEDARRMATELPHCTFRQIANTGHMVYADNPAAFYATLDEFLTTLK
jgi:pimeloyl-ACP methyl ester carboxylesterase